MSDKRTWITGVPLQIAMEADALKPGDWVKLNTKDGLRDYLSFTRRDYHGHEAQLVPIPHSAGETGYTYTIAGGGHEGRWWLSRENIAAWSPQQEEE